MINTSWRRCRVSAILAPFTNVETLPVFTCFMHVNRFYLCAVSFPDNPTPEEEAVGEVSIQVDLFTHPGTGEHKITVKGTMFFVNRCVWYHYRALISCSRPIAYTKVRRFATQSGRVTELQKFDTTFFLRHSVYLWTLLNTIRRCCSIFCDSLMTYLLTYLLT